MNAMQRVKMDSNDLFKAFGTVSKETQGNAGKGKKRQLPKKVVQIEEEG